MIVLGIESSCDETAVSIVNHQKQILANILHSQIKIHQDYGGVIPELSARSHLEIIDQLIIEALNQAKLKLDQIDGFAGTSGPGLIGGVIVGMTCAKTLASIYHKPFLAINHLRAHALAIRLEQEISFPYLVLLVSGGHCQILICKAIDQFYKIGETIDDALGECFDKVAQMLGLNYPGGPEIERMAINGNVNSFKFPKPLIDNNDKNNLFNFSFSGLKTAVRRTIEKITNQEFDHLHSPKKINEQIKSDICASFQNCVSEILLNRIENVYNNFNQDLLSIDKNKLDLVISGGVACNQFIFNKLKHFSTNNNFKIIIPSKKLCTDNAMMIAWNGIEKLRNNLIDQLDFKPRAKWDL